MHESSKIDNVKENDKKKKMQHIDKKLKDFLWDVALYFKLSFLRNSSQWYM